MRKKKVPKISVIEERSAARFEETLNEAFTDLADQDGFRFEVKDPTPDGVFRAFLFWNECEDVPEDARDLAHIAGIRYTCGQCPYAEFPADKRVKRGFCPVETHVWKDSEACVLAYKQAAAGKIKMEVE